MPASRKWLVFASAFFILMIDVGFVYSFGSLFPAILEEFGDNRASTAAIQSVFTGIGPSSGTFCLDRCQSLALFKTHLSRNARKPVFGVFD